MSSWDFDPIIYKRRKGTIEDPFVFYDRVSHLIQKNMAFLQELPDIGNRVRIEGLYETQSSNPESGKFYVDYRVGYVVFNEDLNNTIVQISYYGAGVTYFSADRVYTVLNDGKITETLEDFVKNIKYLTQDQLDQLGGKVTKTGDTMTGQLNMDNENGIMFGNKFRIKHNANTNTLDISYFEE